jgi:hypothetical protein
MLGLGSGLSYLPAYLPTYRSFLPFLSRNGGVKLQKDGSEMAAENTEKGKGSRSGDNLVASKKME